MVLLRACTVAAVFATVLSLPLRSAAPALPDYKLGDVAREDVVTPVPLLVVNPEATEALRQKVAQEVVLIVRFTPQTAVEAETELRARVAQARSTFLTTLQAGLGRAPVPVDADSAPFRMAVTALAGGVEKEVPWERLAPLWVRGLSDEAGVESLLQPLRAVMAQPIVSNRTETPLPANQPVRVLPVKSATEPPTARELESGGTTMPSGRVLSLWRARRLVETHFAAGQEDLGRFAATFVRANATPDAALTEVARAQRMEGLTVNDTYDAAQVIVRAGQTLDRKTLSALAVLREKSMIGTLQTKLQQEQVVAGTIDRQTRWILGALAGLGLGVVFILWRLRARPTTALVPLPGGVALTDGASPALRHAGGGEWRDRALLAEGQAQRAQQAIRSGVLAWMREKIVQTLFRHRAELLSAQQKAEAEMRELEQRLEQLQTPLQERITAYEKRIAELEHDLAARGEENRELIGARISVARQQLLVERERGRFSIN